MVLFSRSPRLYLNRPNPNPNTNPKPEPVDPSVRWQSAHLTSLHRQRTMFESRRWLMYRTVYCRRSCHLHDISIRLWTYPPPASSVCRHRRSILLTHPPNDHASCQSQDSAYDVGVAASLVQQKLVGSHQRKNRRLSSAAAAVLSTGNLVLGYWQQQQQIHTRVL